IRPVDKSQQRTQIRGFSIVTGDFFAVPLALSHLLSQSCHMRASGALAGLARPISRACRTTSHQGDILT
ncbi:MAG: hypothetical protein KKB78_08985, partial [Alphaproteobacteria bacterium]|nr:hypothetical protein [Alphaproteobacteria bacterium]